MADGQLIHWFRNDLRLHDMPSLSLAMTKCSKLYPVYIFDKTGILEKRIGYNRLRYIIESLEDIDRTFKASGGRLYVFCGEPTKIMKDLMTDWNITHLSYEDDIQPVWTDVESSIQDFCRERNVEIINKVSHTLYDPKDILKANRGNPPVTYNVFCQVAQSLGPPPKPEPPLKFENIMLSNEEVLDSKIPSSPEDLGATMECPEQTNRIWRGGERKALELLNNRLQIEKDAAESGILMPNQAQPDLLSPSMSLSAPLSMGCLSVRKEENDSMLECWNEGKTGFPLIDAAVRQMRQEGWIHHVARNAIACFLTRGDLWISWEEGFKTFMKYMIDADFAVCAGNWMWVSSSAFENILQCPSCVSPVTYLRRFDRSGNYIKKYIPELKNMPTQFVFEPWLAPLSIQESAGCILGKDYPLPIVNHDMAATKSTEKMNAIKEKFLTKSVPLHCTPSSPAETRIFMWLPENCLDNLIPQN
nr:cryptochrome-1 [Parasteatoda tepidariorum]